MDEPEELLDLVDSNDNVIGTLSRHDVLSLEENNVGFTRAVGVFIVNDQGQLWVPRRGVHKKIAPGGLDFSAGEHVGSGEPYEVAAIRGLKEELNITADPTELHEFGSVPPFTGMPYFHKIYGYHSNEVPHFNTADYDTYEWLSPQEAISRLSSGEPAKEILLPSVQLLTQSLENKGDL
jgi:isopentenyl-diphosphate delta-isomerase